MHRKINGLIKFIVVVVALQILNISIDIPASQKDITASPEYNYIDTYVEYITEIVLKYENAIPETKHRQQKQFQLHKQLQLICQVVQLLGPAALQCPFLTSTFPAYSNRFSYQYIQEINPPPPKVA